MRLAVRVAALMFTAALHLGSAELEQQARLLANEGKSAEGLAALRNAVRSNSSDPEAAGSLARYLDRYGSASALDAYESYLRLLGTSGSTDEKKNVLRRMVVLSLERRDHPRMERYLGEYSRLGGTDLNLPTSPTSAPAHSYGQVQIPGPLKSFARMTAITPELAPEQVLSALARNIVISGFRASGADGGMAETEYLRLVFRYLEQARELEAMAGPSHMLEVPSCDTPEAGTLLKALGYRMRGGCGGDVVLETVNPTKAFITVDSGFPIADLETALRTNRPFRYDMTPTVVPILYDTAYWQLDASANKDKSKQPIEQFLSDPARCRLYLSVAKLEPTTADLIRKEVDYDKLRAFAHVIDFYAGMFHVANGRVVPPGDAASASKWESMVGGSLNKPADFFMKLIAKDDGWLACYYDSLSRIEGPAKVYLTDANRLEKFYGALRGRITSPGPARPVFRANTDMLIFTHRFRLEPDGRPHVPGGLGVWKAVFAEKRFVDDRKLRKAATSWQEPDDLLAALFGLSRSYTENVPLKMFVALSEFNRNRTTPLEPATVTALIDNYDRLQSQYSLLAESPDLSEDAIQLFISATQSLGKLRNEQLRGDAVGSMQGLLGLWQIYTRHGILQGSTGDAMFRNIVNAYTKVDDHAALFDQTQGAVLRLLEATNGKGSADTQGHLVRLLAGTQDVRDSEVLNQQVKAMSGILESQRLISITDLFALAEQLRAAASGSTVDIALVNKLTTKIGRIQSARSSLSLEEKNALSFGRFTEEHIDRERKLRLRAEVDKNLSEPEKLWALREHLAPHLRDTLVGLNYAHYAPPGGQILQTNSQFVRYHDFAGLQGQDYGWAATEVVGVGWNATSGGRLMGSLSELPYALAQAEQNFLIPDKEQALIWGDLVPQMLLTATVPRWWKVTPAQRHYVALLQRAGSSMVAEAMLNEQNRAAFTTSLEKWSNPGRVAHFVEALESRDVSRAEQLLTPAELFNVAYEMLRANKNLRSTIYDEIRQMQASDSNNSLDMATISDLFGTPKPALTRSYRQELLGLRTMPTLMGYSSRLMAETWESGALYWAELSDRLHIQPAELNILIPTWTRETVEGIFATHLEDWPALLRSMRRVAENKSTNRAETASLAPAR